MVHWVLALSAMGAIGLIVSLAILFALQVKKQTRMVQQHYNQYFNDVVPRPINPSHGVVALTRSITEIPGSIRFQDIIESGGVENNSSIGQRRNRPLRILVIGDSFALGEGVSDQAYPVLPEKLASALAEQLECPVYWSCYGIKGITVQALRNNVRKGIMLQQEEPQSHSDSSSHHRNRILFQDCFEQFKNIHENDDYHPQESPPNSLIWQERLRLHEKMYNMSPYSGFDIVVPMIGTNDGKQALAQTCSCCLFGRKSNPAGGAPNLKDEFKGFLEELSSMGGAYRQSGQQMHSLIIFFIPPLEIIPNKFWGRALSLAAILTRKFTWDIFQSVIHDHNTSRSEKGGDKVFCCNLPTTKENVLDFIRKKSASKLLQQLDNKTYHVKLVNIEENEKEKKVEEMKRFEYSCPNLKRKNAFSAPLFSKDGIHPNSMGYEFYSLSICVDILEIIHKCEE